MLTKILSALGVAPKNLPQASETIGTAKATLEQLNALFAAAGLDAETMLAAGPDSLKAHLASLDQGGEVTKLGADLTAARSEIESLKASATENAAKLTAATQTVSTAQTLFASVGFTGELSTSTDPKALRAKFANHVKEQAALELAKAGHATGVKEVATETITTAAAGLSGIDRVIAAFRAKK